MTGPYFHRTKCRCGQSSIDVPWNMTVLDMTCHHCETDDGLLEEVLERLGLESIGGFKVQGLFEPDEPQTLYRVTPEDD